MKTNAKDTVLAALREAEDLGRAYSKIQTAIDKYEKRLKGNAIYVDSAIEGNFIELPARYLAALLTDAEVRARQEIVDIFRPLIKWEEDTPGSLNDLGSNGYEQLACIIRDALDTL